MNAGVERPNGVGGRRRSDWRARTLLPGDWVEVLPASDIVRTLDRGQAFEGLPFMPEMLPFCGRRYRVALRAERTCVHPPEHPLRRMENAVVLAGLRCDGALHGGCQLGCMFLWKESWLRRAPAARRDGPVAQTDVMTAVGEPSAAGPAVAGSKAVSADAVPGQALASHATADAVAALRVSPIADAGRFFCQATELPKATARGIPTWKPGQYLRFLRVRTMSLPEVVAMFGRPLLRRGRWLAGSLLPQRTAPPGAVEPALGLQAGEWVEVRSREEVLQTLDAQGSVKGLYFNADMYRHCGHMFQVRQRVERVVVERTGKLQQVRDTVILEGSICDRYRGCARGLPILWREAWLKRVDASAAKPSAQPNRHWTSA